MKGGAPSAYEHLLLDSLRGDPTFFARADEVEAAWVAPLLTRGDVIVESGNSFYQDTIRRAEWLEQKGLALLDQGTSGGIWGLELGYCLMIGGSRERIDEAAALWWELARLRSSTEHLP